MSHSDPNPSSTTRAASRRRLLAAILSGALLAASCGSGSEGGGGEDPTATAAGEPEPTTTETTVATTAVPESTTTVAPTTTTVAPADLPMPTTAEELAAALNEAESAVRDADLDTETGRAWGRRSQRLYRAVDEDPAMAATALELVDPAIRDDVADNQAARRHLSALVTSTRLADELPAWRIDEPEPVDDLLAAYQAAEDATGVEWEYLASINLIETRMGRINGLSTAGAVGPMQFLPSTWEGCCDGDPTIDADAIMGAAVYLTQVGAPADMDGALFSYNRSTDYVQAVKAYARVMQRDPLAYRGYHAYEVFFRSSAGLIQMPVGYLEPEPVDAAEWIVTHPDSVID